MNRREGIASIPIDLIFEIFLRLPAISIAKCRCVSKLWASILRGPDFTELFLSRSWAPPQLLFSCDKDVERFLFSTPQLQNQDENSSLVVSTNHLTRLLFDSGSSGICGCVLSLVCRKGTNETLPVICNPSTGQSLNLPEVTSRIGVASFFGYDPTDKQYKILSMSYSYETDHGRAKKHQVLTLGTKKPSWRMVECCMSHHPSHEGICINGGLYYKATDKWWGYTSIVVCFDVRSEKFTFINTSHYDCVGKWWHYSTLVNYKGKLGVLISNDHRGLTRNSRDFQLWVLKDPEKHEWTKHIHHVLPPLWKNVVAYALLELLVQMRLCCRRTIQLTLSMFCTTISRWKLSEEWKFKD